MKTWLSKEMKEYMKTAAVGISLGAVLTGILNFGAPAEEIIKKEKDMIALSVLIDGLSIVGVEAYRAFCK